MVQEGSNLRYINILAIHHEKRKFLVEFE